MSKEQQPHPISRELDEMRERHAEAMNDLQTRHPNMSIKMYDHEGLGKIHVISEGPQSVPANIQKTFLEFQKIHGLQAKDNIGRTDCDSVVREFIKFSKTRPEFSDYECRGLWMENSTSKGFLDAKFFRELDFSHHALCLISPKQGLDPSPTMFVDLTASYNIDASQNALHVLVIAAHDQLSAYAIFTEITEMFSSFQGFET